MYKRQPITIEITMKTHIYCILEISNPFLPHTPNYQSLVTLENCAKMMKRNIKNALTLPAQVKNLI